MNHFFLILSWKGEGMDDMEFTEAVRDVQDLITEYVDKHDAQFDPEELSSYGYDDFADETYI